MPELLFSASQSATAATKGSPPATTQPPHPAAAEQIALQLLPQSSETSVLGSRLEPRSAIEWPIARAVTFEFNREAQQVHRLSLLILSPGGASIPPATGLSLRELAFRQRAATVLQTVPPSSTDESDEQARFISSQRARASATTVPRSVPR